MKARSEASRQFFQINFFDAKLRFALSNQQILTKNTHFTFSKWRSEFYIFLKNTKWLIKICLIVIQEFLLSIAETKVKSFWNHWLNFRLKKNCMPQKFSLSYGFIQNLPFFCKDPQKADRVFPESGEDTIFCCFDMKL